jgi:hypothetical protein
MIPVHEHLAEAELARLDELPADRRAELLSRAADCAECRRRLVAVEAAAVFALLADDPLPAGALERLSARVDSEVDRLQGHGRGWRGAVGSVAAAVLLAAFLGTYVSQRDDGPAPPAPAPALLEAKAPLPGIELLSTPGRAEVVDVEVGGTRVVMIFDKELDI